MKSHYPKPEVGMEVFIVDGKYKSNSIITAVGRKWIYFGKLNQRFDKETWKIDGGKYVSPGIVYPSEQYYLEERDLNNAWDELITLVRCIRIPKNMTVEKIKEIIKLMELDQ